MLPHENVDFPDLHVWILRCFEAHKLEFLIGSSINHFSR